MLVGWCVQVQRCTLLSIKTGGCPETCNYCAQSSSWSKDTGLKAEKLMGLEDVYEASLHSPDTQPSQPAILLPYHAAEHAACRTPSFGQSGILIEDQAIE